MIASANERVLPAAQLLKEGYRRVSLTSQATNPAIPTAQSLAWPVDFQDEAHTVANAMAQFQPFDNPPYFHGGCDLRVEADAAVRAPVAGKLEAGHYSYATRADGSMEKFWMPWPQQGSEMYFEVAVVADDGIRYEFHHVNRENLPAGIVAMLNRGGGRVEKGALLGHAIYWPDGDYHHIHYNLVMPNGVRINPEFVSPLLPDHQAPELKSAYARLASGKLVNFGDGKFAERVTEFLVVTLDRLDAGPYEHPVSVAKLRLENEAESGWDFRQTLTTAEGRFPVLDQFFMKSLRTPDGRTLRTEGGYGTGQSIVRLAVPAGATGSFRLVLEDISGNASSLSGML